MRILQICSARTLGGGERHLSDLANSLAARGHDTYAALLPSSPLLAKLPALSTQNILTLPMRNPLDVISVTEKVPAIFVEFRRSPQEITDTYMRTKVRDAFSRIASTMPVVEIFGAKKQELLAKVKEDLMNDLEPKGFRIDSISMVGNPRLDPNVAASINNVIQAAQRAQEAQNKVAQVEAEARQKVAEAVR